MIKINLLPQEYHKEKVKFTGLLELVLPMAVPVIAAIVILLLLVIIYPKWQMRTLNRLEKQWSKIKGEYDKVISLKGEKEGLRLKLDTVSYIIAKRMSWAEKLNEINDAIPSSIQLTRMSTKKEEHKDKEPQEVLVIEGNVPAYPGEKAIEEFMTKLSGDPRFTEDFPQIELPITETTKEGLKKFILRCYINKKYIIEEQKPKEKKGARTELPAQALRAVTGALPREKK